MKTVADMFELYHKDRDEFMSLSPQHIDGFAEIFNALPVDDIRARTLTDRFHAQHAQMLVKIHNLETEIALLKAMGRREFRQASKKIEELEKVPDKLET